LNTKKKAVIAWSGGKESAFALHEFREKGDCEISALLTTLSKDYDRISMHGVRRVLLEEQASSLGLPLEKVFISKSSSNEEYESKMRESLEKYKIAGIASVVFGDVFLEDLRKYREEKLSKIGMKAIFPIWKRNTTELARTFIKLGFKAIVTCVDSRLLEGKFAGKVFDEQFLSELPPSVDPCGENGEFHSFVHDGPIFQKGLLFEKGEIVLRDNRFYYCDLKPVHNNILTPS